MARASSDRRSDPHSEKVLIVDFGSQVTQLIARRVRESGVYSEIHPYDRVDAGFLKSFRPKAVILSGGPASVHQAGTPRAPDALWTLGVPVLGICYGQMAMQAQLGGRVESGAVREFGRASLRVTGASKLFQGVWKKGARPNVWMSHGDRVIEPAPGFKPVAISKGAPFAVLADERRRFYGVMFHPEVHHTPDGAKLLANFTHRVAGCEGTWSMKAFKEDAIKRIRKQVGKGRVICGLSGGVDSSVVAALLHEAIDDQLTCVFVDTGLLRQGEAKQVADVFRGHYNIPLISRDASELFL
ncbi:MAG: glutamine-hydrolyzing GMP synthase, partial [Rhodospirillales bacterium]